MEGESQEDWEILHGSEDNNSNNVEEIEEDVMQGMMLTFDYFSLKKNNGDERSEDGSVQTSSPGWIEPRSDIPYGPKHFSELWSDSSSDRIEEQRLVDDDEEEVISRNDLSLVGEGERVCVSMDPFVKSGGGREERGLVWWKIPFDVLKYCVFRVNPVWSFSMAAAVVGFVMLGRRLYIMQKKKNPTLQLKFLLHDKKVANNAARWNEAIPEVKRVPIIRPPLPSTVGMNQWSLVSLR